MTKKTERPARDVNAAIRVQQALLLRTMGHTYDEIANRCGYDSRGAAYHAVQRELQRNIATSVDDMRLEECLRLDALLKTYMPRALKAEAWACDRVLHIMERRAKLMGLDIKPEEAAVVNMTLVRQIAADMEAV